MTDAKLGILPLAYKLSQSETENSFINFYQKVWAAGHIN